MNNPPTIGAATVTNCKFEYECPKDWFKLMPTDPIPCDRRHSRKTQMTPKQQSEQRKRVMEQRSKAAEAHRAQLLPGAKVKVWADRAEDLIPFTLSQDAANPTSPEDRKEPD
ncbi:hypothetical protein ACT80S_06465 [Ramlibacter sp. MAHUQ-53]|uniref:hypothetical protein n=1 Tax=unclassified Ramlibacter TaxID=2617605 RepID=UPI003633DA5E